MPNTMQFIPLQFASAALPVASPPIRVEQIKGVSLWTVSYSRVSGRHTDASEDIFLSGDYLQMLWIHTGSIATQMVNRQPFGDGADTKFIGKPMNKNHSPFYSDSSISFSLCPHPKPARCRLTNPCPKTFRYWLLGLSGVGTLLAGLEVFCALQSSHSKTPWFKRWPTKVQAKWASACTRGLSFIIPQRAEV